ncbi:hypothetical protein NL676_030701 [Syzygium grande]|nr:hypothetical protein NL676_030701 [Syzygium grande]
MADSSAGPAVDAVNACLVHQQLQHPRHLCPSARRRAPPWRSSTPGWTLPSSPPCPASNGLPWNDNILKLLDRAQMEMWKIGELTPGPDDCDLCAICCLAKGGVPNPFDMIPGGSVKIIREPPIMATVRFMAGSVEPQHHHTFAHDQAVLKGKMSVWNLTKKQRYDLVAGDYLFTPGGDVRMVKYHEDTKFLVKWYGHCDTFFHEDLKTAKMAIGE